MFSIVTSRLLTPHNGRSLTSVRCCEALSVYVYGWWLAAISGLCAGAFGAGFLVVAPGVGRIVFFSCHSGLACHSIAASPCGLPVPAPPYVPHCAMVARQHDGSCASRVVSLVRMGTAACVSMGATFAGCAFRLKREACHRSILFPCRIPCGDVRMRVSFCLSACIRRNRRG